MRTVKGFGGGATGCLSHLLGAELQIKPKVRLVREEPEPLVRPRRSTALCSTDFVHDELSAGRSFRLSNVLDDCNREDLGIEVDLPLSSARVIRSLERLIEWRGRPGSLCLR